MIYISHCVYTFLSKNWMEYQNKYFLYISVCINMNKNRMGYQNECFMSQCVYYTHKKKKGTDVEMIFVKTWYVPIFNK